MKPPNVCHVDALSFCIGQMRPVYSDMHCMHSSPTPVLVLTGWPPAKQTAITSREHTSHESWAPAYQNGSSLYSLPDAEDQVRGWSTMHSVLASGGTM